MLEKIVTKKKTHEIQEFLPLASFLLEANFQGQEKGPTWLSGKVFDS